MNFGRAIRIGLVFSMMLVAVEEAVLAQGLESSTEIGTRVTQEPSVASFWQHVEEVIEAVQGNHPQPPTTQEMVARGLAAWDETDLTESYAKRVQAISKADPSELRDIVESAWQSHPDFDSGADDLVDGFIGGMLSAGLGSPAWISIRESRVTKQLNENRYVGIGIALAQTDDKATITETLYGGPAWKTGLKAGDRIVAVDGENSVGIGLREVVGRLRGPLETELSVTVEREGELVDFDMTRLEVPIASVESIERKSVDEWNVVCDKEHGVAYLRLDRIAGSTAAELRALLRQAQEQKCDELILDLRQCRGGDFHQTVMVADVLCGAGVVGKRKVRGRIEEIKSSTPSAWGGRPMIILSGAGSTADMVWLMDAVRQQASVRVVGPAFESSAYATSNVDLPSGGIISGLPIGTLMLHPREESSTEGPALNRVQLPRPEAVSMMRRLAHQPDWGVAPQAPVDQYLENDPSIKLAHQLLEGLRD